MENIQTYLVDDGLTPELSVRQIATFQGLVITIEFPNWDARLEVHYINHENPANFEEQTIFYKPRKYWLTKGKSESEEHYVDYLHEISVRDRTINLLGNLISRQ